MLSRYSFPAAVVLVILSIGASCRLALAPYVREPVVDLTYDVDWGYLNQGLDRIHGFGDTARWWTGTWCGEVPFWRPLTSYVFWGMRLLWATEYMLPRQIVSVLLHLTFIGVSYAFIRTITGRKWLALLSIWLFAGIRLPVFLFSGPVSVRYMLSSPKNVPDPLVGIAVITALLLLAKGRWAAGLAMAVVSVGFKEIGFATWPLALILLVWLHRDRLQSAHLRQGIQRNLLPICLWTLALVILILVHWSAVGFGYRLGMNKCWYWRMADYFGGPFFASLISPEPSPAVTGFLAFLGLLLLRRRWLPIRLLAVIVALGAGTLVGSHTAHVSWDVAMARLLLPDGALPVILICAVWLAIAWEARHDWQTVLLGLAMAFIAAAPTWFATQALPHGRYLASFFLEVTVAAALIQAGNRLLAIKHSPDEFRPSGNPGIRS